jgi:16S rRNA (cytidine1402-2'-O)-methyltransferase
LISYHEHNEAKRTAELLPRLEAGERLALVSDAGCRGSTIRVDASCGLLWRRGSTWPCSPGPSAVETALVASGLVGEQYQFIGYLPRVSARCWSSEESSQRRPWAVVAFESPQRLPRSLRSSRAWSPIAGAVCRELTKRFEEVARGSVAELAERFPSWFAARSRSCSAKRPFLQTKPGRGGCRGARRGRAARRRAAEIVSS